MKPIITSTSLRAALLTLRNFIYPAAVFILFWVGCSVLIALLNHFVGLRIAIVAVIVLSALLIFVPLLRVSYGLNKEALESEKEEEGDEY